MLFNDTLVRSMVCLSGDSLAMAVDTRPSGCIVSIAL